MLVDFLDTDYVMRLMVTDGAPRAHCFLTVVTEQ